MVGSGYVSLGSAGARSMKPLAGSTTGPVKRSGCRSVTRALPTAQPTAAPISASGREKELWSASGLEVFSATARCAATAMLGAFILATADCGAASANPNLAVGEQVFSGNCAACHAGGNNVIMAEKTLRKEALEQYLDGGFNEEAIISQVENGKNAMPAWGDRLTEEEIQSVAAYVFDTASKNGW